MLISLLLFCFVFWQSSGAGDAPMVAEKTTNLKTMNANGDFADFNQQMIEQGMSFTFINISCSHCIIYLSFVMHK